MYKNLKVQLTLDNFEQEIIVLLLESLSFSRFLLTQQEGLKKRVSKQFDLPKIFCVFLYDESQLFSKSRDMIR